ncbi:hypothetical protein QE152_g3910 [Popillia japonica]|uniref:Uncharacterized protein n=1 Tax=Popillia japonica TaxID=7064 RepID=A0AAW1N4I2_POPJA
MALLPAFGIIWDVERHTLDFGVSDYTIMNINAIFSIFCGLLALIVLNTMNSPKVSTYGSFLIISALFTMIYATTFIHFVVSYGVTETYDKENVHAFIFPNKITAFTSALYGIGASMYKDLISDYTNDFLLSDNNVIVVTIFGNIVATMTFLQPVLASMDDIYDENSKPRNHKTLDKDELIPQSFRSKTYKCLNKIFSLSLLSDGTFVTITIGLAIGFFIEFAYIFMIPYALIETGFAVGEIATFLAVYLTAEMWFRLLAPYIACLFGQMNYYMYLTCSIFLFVVRIFIAAAADYNVILTFAVILGALKGLQNVYWSLVIPEYTTMNKLAASFGWLFIFNGLCIYLLIPLFSLLYVYESSWLCVMFLNCLTILTTGIIGIGIGA